MGHMRVSRGWTCPGLRAEFRDHPGDFEDFSRPVRFAKRPANPRLWVVAWVQSDAAVIVEFHWFAKCNNH